MKQFVSLPSVETEQRGQTGKALSSLELRVPGPAAPERVPWCLGWDSLLSIHRETHFTGSG